jgi:eukaryotic-like serine/threonine-protein kinase
MLKKFSGSILYVLISLLVISLYVDRHSSLEKIELGIQDTMFKLRGKKDMSQDIVIVGIDDYTTQSLGRWPWNRDKVAALVDAIAVQAPKTIALDMNLLPDESQTKAGFSEQLAASISRAHNVVLGYQYSQSDAGLGPMMPDGLAGSAYRVFDNASNFSKYPPQIALRLYSPETQIADSAARLGFVNVSIDKDRKIRWQQLVVGFRGEFFPSLQVVAAAHYLNVSPSQLKFEVGRAIDFGARHISTDRLGQMCINFNGPEKTFTTYSALDILKKQVAPRELSGKLVIVGYDGYGATNIYPTPVSPNLSGLELDANIIENIVHQNTLKGMSGVLNISLIILIAIGVFSALILPNVSLLNRIIILAVFLIVLVNINYILFSTFNIMAKTFYPGLEIILFLAVAPMIKTEKEARSPGDEADEDVDYESLLSSSQSMPVDSWSASTEPPPHSETPRPTAISSDDQTFYNSQDTKPVRETITGTVAVSENTQTDHFGRYKILRPIGKGAMGMVYQGLDPAIDRPVALKTIRLDNYADPSETRELKERLVREAKAAGKLSHPNIVTIYDVGEEASMQYIAMEFLQGNTLESLLKHGLDWDYRTISKVMIQACEALDYAHENGIVHRDIKPANIMILEGNKVKVMDFGIARLDKSASMTQTGTALGTPNYISPEQLKGQPVDRRSDIFSLGVVFYEVLTHEKPFKGETISALIYSILHTEPPRPSEINLDIPRIFDKIIAKGLVKDPDLRFQRAKDMADILRKLI